jgi:DNA-binding PadR family transcriptional regulator
MREHHHEPHRHETRPRRPHHGPFGHDPLGGLGMPWATGDWGPRHGRGRRRGRSSRGRSRRGDVRAAILTLLAEADGPKHGYEMISEISERSGGFWKPSPGSVYPTLQLLSDEGLIDNVGGRSGKRLFELTDAGREAAAQLGDTPPWEQIAQDVEPTEVALRHAATALHGALFQVATVGTAAQQAKAVTVVNEARSALYGILGEIEEPAAPDSPGDEPPAAE